MSRRHYLKVPAVKGRDFAQVEPLGEGDDARVHNLKPQGRIGSQQLSHPAVIMRSGFDDTQLIGGDGGAEQGRQPAAAPALRVG